MSAAQTQMSLGDYLVREGFISQAQFNRALEAQRQTGRSIGRILVEMELITESMRMTILQKQFRFQLIRLKDSKVDPILLTLIPYAFAEKHRVVPVKQESNRTLVVAMEDPSDILVLDMIKSQVGLPVHPCIASHDDIQLVLNQYSTGEQRAAEETKLQVSDRWWYRLLKKGGFPVLALLPLFLFFAFIWFDVYDLPRVLNSMRVEGQLTTTDLLVYIALAWGLWTIILFWINGFIFGEEDPQNREET